ncbi:MAG: M20/M25/M40 family metallo-hydrolase, partial [Phycisphaerales bacterium]|nr:M20/M25/M40 family metallo-hydrolase [Phycisphaerales bacterium]
HILYYGHYDVQPPDPLELWESGPFEPTIVEGKNGPTIVARGACDDKGQLMMFVEALRAWHEVGGGIPVRATVLLEGEEESGSPSLDAFLEANADELRPDVCVVSDTGMWNPQTPAITTMLRGMVYLEATLHGPSHDLHSGMCGGAVVNPINALCSVLAGLHDADGRIAISGFYDGIIDPSETQHAQWAELGFDEAGFLQEVGLPESTGETGCTILERIWSRPTLDVNGIFGGYTGDGAKTVIPSHATAKFSCRLVPGQNPEAIEAMIRGYLEKNTPAGCRWTIVSHGANPAIQVPDESPWLEAAQGALKQIWGRPAVLMGCGGSIPVVGSFQTILKADSLLIGFGLDDDRVHSPNEKFDIACFRGGVRSHAAVVMALAAVSDD